MKKIDVMIVDDEKLVLEDLSTIVDWEAYGFRIAATAFNGKQALTKYHQYKPQVIITDMRMPIMDGIELMENIRKIDKEVLIIVLTAYEDFAYAKSAIHHGIMDYIIKSTINEAMAVNLLKRIRATIENQGEILDIIKEKQIEEFFLSNEEAEDNHDLFHTAYGFLYIEQVLPINLSGDYMDDFITIHKADIISELSRMDSTEYKLVAISSTHKDHIVMLLDINSRSQQAISNLLLQTAKEIRRRLGESFDRDFAVYYLPHKLNLPEAKRIYLEKSFFFYQKYLGSSCNVYNLLDSKTVPGLPEKELEVDVKRLEQGIEEYELKKVSVYMDELFQRVSSYKELYNISRILYDMLKQMRKQISGSVGAFDLSLEGNWRSWMNRSSLSLWFKNQYEELINELKNSHHQQYSKPVAQAIDYIYSHYMNVNLGINDIADETQLSAGYLCVLFKKETGKTINNFISEVRIAQAKKLLCENKLKVYEISAAVGFQSSQYFSQVFIRQAGLSPNEYQKGKGKEHSLLKKAET